MTAQPGIPGVAPDGTIDALEARTVPELRVLRSLLQQREDDQSLLRRLVQGRLDIVRAEHQRRTLGDAAGLGAVLADLPVTLAGPVESSPPARAQRGSVEGVAPEHADELDALCGIAELRRLPELVPDELDALASGLVVLERATSQRRHALHRALDAVSAELAQRYATGEASVDDLLGPGLGDDR